MKSFVFRRLAYGLLAVFFLMVAVFILARLTGDPTYLLVSDWATPEEVELVRARFGLDKSYPEQFYVFMRGLLLYGDLGDSIFLGRPTVEIFFERLPNSLQLILLSILFSVALAIPLGVVAATNRGTVFDQLAQPCGGPGHAGNPAAFAGRRRGVTLHHAGVRSGTQRGGCRCFG